jgi:hypothetical protein
MKRVTMTFTVFLENDLFVAESSGRGLPPDHMIECALYDHLCDWEGNSEGTMDVSFANIEYDVEIGDPEKFETVRIK